MSDTLTYWDEQNLSPKKEETTENVKHILDLYSLLATYEKAQLKIALRDKNIF